MFQLINKVRSYLNKNQTDVSPEISGTKRVIQRSKHQISRKQISKEALDVLYQLKRAGYDTYLVGGAVRDLLLGLSPKDFDVVTNATPEEIKKVFKRQCRLIGRRFRLAHIVFGREIIEVATFRGDGDGGLKGKLAGKKQLNHVRQTDDSGRLLKDNVYGTIEEDVWRRDFTVNSLYYNIKNFSIVDYAGGFDDIHKGVIRLIGDPETRYREDPVRMIRAIRFAVKLGFEIEQQTENPIFEMGELLASVSNARMFEEVLKLFHSGKGVEILDELRHYDLFQFLFPLTDDYLEDGCDKTYKVIIEALKSTDNRIQNNLGVNPSFLFAAMLWQPFINRMEIHLESGLTQQDAVYAAAEDVIEQQIPATAIPKRFSIQIREIWRFQFRLPNTQGNRAQKIHEHPRFRAAYDFLGIRVQAGEKELETLFDWWTDYQEKNPIDRVAFTNDLKNDKPRYSKRTNRNHFRKRQNSSQKSTGS